MYQNDETLPNFIKRKHPKKGREKKTRGKDQSPSKQARPKHASKQARPSMHVPKAVLSHGPPYEQDPMTLHRGKVWIMLQKNL